ncbi:MAG: hypothetical protein HDR24_07295 [Lachnospiraceae bacterium]|nr:hypothetical protein [Lachnospiraceae bacterium]
MEKIFQLNSEIRQHDGDVVIYGTTPEALLLFGGLLNHDVYVKCFCDMDSTYYGAKIMNKPCVSLEKIKMLNNPIVLLDISSIDVLTCLLDIGLPEDSIYVDDYREYLKIEDN